MGCFFIFQFSLVLQFWTDKAMMLSFGRAGEFIRMALGSENLFEPWTELRTPSQREELAVEAKEETLRGTLKVTTIVSEVLRDRKMFLNFENFKVI